MILMEKIYLSLIDGFEFEELCKNIFKRLNIGSVERTPLTNDKGKDLIIYTPEGKIFVECKHHLNHVIGRPVIQKLHSAVISENAIKGYVVTSGKFSINAIKHAKTLEPHIELVDIIKLKEIAFSVGIDIHLSPIDDTPENDIQILSFIVNNSIFKSKFIRWLSSKLKSEPKPVKSFIKKIDRKIELFPIYRIDYHIDYVCKTSAHVLNREIGDFYYFIDGIKGNIIDDKIAKIIDKKIKGNMIIKYSDINFKKDVNNIIPTKKSVALLSQLHSKAYDHIIQSHTTIQRYWGNNNVYYEKICKPTKKSIFIKNINLIYLPIEIINVLFGTNNKTTKKGMKIIEKDIINPLLIEDNFFVCDICKKRIEETPYVCNECGAITHPPIVGLFGQSKKSHGFHCEICGRTLCRNHAYYYKQYFLFRKTVCENCARKMERKNKKIYSYKNNQLVKFG